MSQLVHRIKTSFDNLPMLQINEFRLGQLSASKILVTIDFQNLGFPNFNFLGGVAIANKQKYK